MYPQMKVKKGTPRTMDTPCTFEQWKQRIDNLLAHVYGITSDDLPDCTWRDWYDDGLRPIYAANRALKRAVD